jgi:hypothetical protein
MKKFWLVKVTLAVLLVVAPFAKADSFIVKVDATGPDGKNPITGQGTISVELVGGIWEINSADFSFDGGITGTLIQNPNPGSVEYYDLGPNSSGFTSTKPAATEDYIYFDNILTSETQSPFFDENGILLQLSDGGIMNFFYSDDGTAYYVEYGGQGWVTLPDDDSNINIPAHMSIAPAPEPSSLSLLGAGLLAIAGFLFWKGKNRLVNAA